MAWITLRRSPGAHVEVQTSAIRRVREDLSGCHIEFDRESDDTHHANESREEIRALIAAAEEAEQRRNARIVAETQSVWATEAMGWKDRATEAQVQIEAAREERDAARADAERLREALSKCRPIVLSLEGDWDFSDAELADAMAALKGAE